ncbi:putative sterigmatocystin biosynthesis P450 monooxygenase [Escovopsis weberi]|uniref:Putative sterigmatocystin biosynthesis P450 monooxygenase n=1 Tax=Escovopsis weberi TaxID=150374 RepID=A0A0M9VUE1_ESCWE|nr:putative sterigmatocystin biosynthesis P450 monooxygenase [Escovopsis weberi]
MGLTTPLLAALLLLAVQLVRCLTSPLRHVPGPMASGFTSLVLRWKEMTLSRTLYVHELHRQYGPVVRLAPDEVSFTSWAALKEIYCSGGSGYDKTEFYDMFQVFGRRTMFTQLNKADHAKRKRLLADRYANSNVLKSESLEGIKERAARFVQRCASAPAGVADIYDDEEMMHQVAADDSSQNRLIGFYAPFLHLLFSKVITLFVKPRETPLADNYVLEKSSLGGYAEFALMSRLGEKSDQLDPVGKASECLDHMAAGIDTTGDGLCFLMWELSQPRSLHVQRRLAQELRENPDAANDQLPFLDAVVWEGLRCFPPIPMSLPRYVPSGGRSIDGFWIPENTKVGCQAYSVQRLNADVFPEPDSFHPDRWLDSDGDAERKRLLFAFSNGGRGCIGKHLALAEMKTLLRSVYSAFSTTANSATTEELMALSEQLISARPLGQNCHLEFHPLETAEPSKE